MPNVAVVRKGLAATGEAGSRIDAVSLVNHAAFFGEAAVLGASLVKLGWIALRIPPQSRTRLHGGDNPDNRPNYPIDCQNRRRCGTSGKKIRQLCSPPLDVGADFTRMARLLSLNLTRGGAVR